jgi:hypothetical protein
MVLAALVAAAWPAGGSSSNLARRQLAGPPLHPICPLPPSRHDRGNTQLAADLEELRACMAPADAAALRQRGDARARAGDAQGAAEAYGLLLRLPEGQVGGRGRRCRGGCPEVAMPWSPGVVQPVSGQQPP